MSKFNKYTSPIALAVAIVAAPVAVYAQDSMSPADPAGPMTTQPGPRTDPPVQSEPMQPSAPTQQSPTQPGTTQPGTTQVPASDPAMQPRAEATPTDGSPQVAAFVDQQFTAADTNGDGMLSPEEFKPWMAELKASESEGQTADAAEAQTYASNAFAAADVDGDGHVTKVELTQFLSQA